MQSATDLLVWAIVAHLIADWLFQNDWMAIHKTSLRHPASWVHSGLHVIALLFILPWHLALAAGGLHLLIDTRIPLNWWMRTVKQMKTGPQTQIVEIWVDQIMHITVLAFLCWLVR